MSIFSDRIKKERENLGLTREELANKIGVSYSAIAMYEQGNREPNNTLTIKLCEIFNCSMDYLMGQSLFKNAREKYDSVRAAEAQLDFYPTNNIEALEKIENVIKNILKNGAHTSDNPNDLYNKILSASNIPELNPTIKTILFCMIEDNIKAEDVSVSFWYNHAPFSNIEDEKKEVDFDSDKLRIGLSAKDYENITEAQIKQIEELAKVILKDNLKNKDDKK